MIHQILFTLVILACMIGLSLLYEMRTTKVINHFTHWDYVFINFLMQFLTFLIVAAIYQLIQP